MKYALSLLLMIGLLLALLPACSRPAETPASKTPLVVYCAAGLKTPMEKAKAAYEEAYNTPIQINYGGSQTLLAQIEVGHRGDLYIPADESYTAMARSKNLIAEVLPLAKQVPILAVPKNSTKNIRTAADLLRSDVRLIVTNPDQAAVGKLTREAFAKDGMWDKLYQRAVTRTATVNEVATALKLGAADAGFIWDTMLPDYPGLQRIDLPELAGHESRIEVTVLKASTQPTAALHLARFLTARDKGLVPFAEHGFQVVEGDIWEDKPTIKLFSGAMLRPAIEKTLVEFEQREGVQITTVYNGCGILVGQMKAGSRPDAYFACDQSFMNQVADLYMAHQTVSANHIVLLVRKGNPKGLKTLQDLAQAGIRVGVGHEEQSALGALTKKVLQEAGVYGRFKPVVESATGDYLVNQLTAGSLDAVLVYVSNAARVHEQADMVRIDVPAALAVQPVAIGKETPRKYLMERLVAALTSADSRLKFEQEGFTWKLGAASAPDAVER